VIERNAARVSCGGQTFWFELIERERGSRKWQTVKKTKVWEEARDWVDPEFVFSRPRDLDSYNEIPVVAEARAAYLEDDVVLHDGETPRSLAQKSVAELTRLMAKEGR
jgi:hypothetical protein